MYIQKARDSQNVKFLSCWNVGDSVFAEMLGWIWNLRTYLTEIIV